MFRTHQPSQAVFRWALTHRDQEERSDAGVLYIGLGDQFDDDRRFVRSAAPALRSVVCPVTSPNSRLGSSSTVPASR